MNIKTKWDDILLLRLVTIYLRFRKIKRKSEFLKKFSIPYSSFYFMRKNFQNHTSKENNEVNDLISSNKINSIVFEAIKNYVLPPQYPITLDKIRQFIYDKIGFSIKKRKIKDILKNSLNYSYKKGSSGSKVLKSFNNKVQKSVFSSRILLHIYNEKLIINIDEASF